MLRRRPLRALALVAFVAIALSTSAVAADTSVPPAPTRTAPAYNPQAFDTWEVRGVYADSTFPFAVQVWDMAEIDGVMYVGGRFLTVREGPGATEYDQPFLAAFDASTGTWIESFRPRLDGVVQAVTPSPDGRRLLVGGEFTSVNGDPYAAGLVALDPTTGAVDTSWTARVTHNAGSTPVVMDIEVVGDDVFVGGTFTHIEGRQASSRTRVWRLAKLDGATGAVDQSFQGKVSGARVIALDSSPDGRRLYLGGYFQIVNGVETRFFATLDTSTGDFSPVPQGLPASPEPTDRVTPVFDIEATSDRVYLATEWHYLHVLDARTGEREYLHWAGGQGGDFQAVKVAGNVLWAGGHDHGFTVPTTITRSTDMVYFLFVRNQGWAASPRVPVQWVSAHDAASGRRLPEFVPRLNMAEGVWDIEVASNGNLWIAGDATRSGTQSVGGFAVFPPGQPGDEVNLAIGGTATQSSVYSCCDPTPRYGTPDKAIDRMTTGNFEEESSSWTLAEAEPWWQVDLGTSKDVSFIRLWPMTHTGGFRNWIPVDIPEMHVFVSERPFLTDDLADTADQAGVTEYVIDSFDDVYEEIPIGRSARYIRVQAPGVAQLGLAEVEVIEGDAPPNPPPGGGDTDLVGGSALWRYWDTPSSPPPGWTSVTFDDAGWSSGQAELGFGDGDEVTVINDSEGGARVLESAFFRTTFSVDDPTAVTGLDLRLLADDGAIVYLNGVEVVRDNVPASGSGYRLRTTTVRFGDDEDTFRHFDVPAGLLQPGENVLSVEVHNYGWWSLDLSFDARLVAS